jgi:hypothetical protein
MMKALEPEVARIQRERPDCGVLLTPVFRQIVPDGFTAIKPGPGVVRIEIGIGHDAGEARFQKQLEWSSVPGPAETEFNGEAVWIPAVQPAEATPEPAPYPAVAHATFTSREPRLTTVGWTFWPFPGFDDVGGETVLDVPEGVEPRFFVLQVPAQVSATDHQARAQTHTAGIDQEIRNGVPVVLLDEYVPGGNDAAAAIYPADAATARLFDTTPMLQNWASIVPHRTTLTRIRWVSADQIQLVTP